MTETVDAARKTLQAHFTRVGRFAPGGEHAFEHARLTDALEAAIRSEYKSFERTYHDGHNEGRAEPDERVCPGCKVFHDLGHPDRVPGGEPAEADERAAALREVAGIVRRHTHQGLYAMTTHAGPDPESDCRLCRALVAAGVLTLDEIGAGTRAALSDPEDARS